MFSPAERERAQQKLVALAERDPRVVAAALIGGSTAETLDRWSDIDLGLAVADGHAVAEVLADWTASLRDQFGAVHLFDVAFLSSLYRVFLLPGVLQVDLSFTPEDDFGARGPRFRVLFGHAKEQSAPRGQPPEQVFGLAVHHALRGRIAIERGRLWHAQHWINGVREEAMGLACRRLGLDPAQGRGYDRLPAEILAAAAPALPARVEREELRRALAAAIDLLLSEGAAAPELADRLRPELAELAGPGALS